MQTAPERWEEFFGSDSVLEMEASIGGRVYALNDLTFCRVSRRLYENTGIGNAGAATLKLGLLPAGAIPRAAPVVLSARLRSGEATTAWVPQGTFWIDERWEEDGILSLVAYDRLRMSEQDYFADGVISGAWPKAAPEVVTEICKKLGTTLDTRTVLNAAILLPAPIGMTIREVLCGIAAAHGGNWTMTAADQLRLIRLEDIPASALLGAEDGAFAADETQNRIVIIDAEHHTIPCETARRTAAEVEISGVTLYLDDDSGYTAGDRTGFLLEAWCPFATQGICDGVLNALRGVRLNGIEVENGICDPLAELGDVMFGGGVLFRAGTMELDYKAACIAELTAPIEGEVEHEFPYQEKAAKEINRKIAQTKAEIRLTADSITQTVSGIDGRVATVELGLSGLTSTVQNQAGDLSALKQTATGLQSQITSANGEISTLKQTATGLQSTVQGLNGEINTMEQTLTGVVFKSSLADGSSTIHGGCIRTGQILANYLKLGGTMNFYDDLNSNTVTALIGLKDVTVNDVTEPATGIYVLSSDRSAVLGSNRNCIYLSGYQSGSRAFGHLFYGSFMAFNNSFIHNQSSDRRKKHEIQYGREAEMVRLFDGLRPVSFHMNDFREEELHLGFIAQDVAGAAETAGLAGALTSIDCNGYYGLNYGELTAVLTAKVRQLEARLEKLEEK